MRKRARHVLGTLLGNGDAVCLDGEGEGLDEAEGVGARDESQWGGDAAVGCWGGGETVYRVGRCQGIEGDYAGGVAGGGADWDVGEGVAGAEVADNR